MVLPFEEELFAAVEDMRCWPAFDLKI